MRRIKLSISDDDICADCALLAYAPGKESLCQCGETEDDKKPHGWPGVTNRDGYFVYCKHLTPCAPGENFIPEEGE